MMNMDAAAWRDEMDAMRRTGIDLVIIQWLEHENMRFFPADSAACDPTRVILEYADEHGMRVFLGLATIDRWRERITYPRYLDRAAALSMRLADQAWASYGREPASVERILKQIDAESPFVTSFVMFDFFHYMSPRRGAAQKKLYEDYLREFMSPARSSR
jgi:hypothetical protein